MPIPFDRVREAVQKTHLDGWLIYDFQGLNPHAHKVLDLPTGAHLTRRFFVYVPREGTPSLIHHRIEAGNWRSLTAGSDVKMLPYSAHTELDAHLSALVRGKHVAMEYSPRGAVPYVSRVDAGTLERVREVGATISSSADLLQRFLMWTEENHAAHARAVSTLMSAKDQGFKLIHGRLQAGQDVTELEVQGVIQGVIEAAGMDSDHPATVGFGVNAADPHYAPGEGKNATLAPGQCVLLDLWCREPGQPFADVTWMGFAGQPTPEFMQGWQAVAAARDEGLEQLRQRAQSTQGWEIDRAARDVLSDHGWNEHFNHRLGHDLGQQLHGPGANLDDLETHDTRKLMDGLAVTVEPGIYVPEQGFGIRSEVDVYLTPGGGAQVTTPVQVGPYVLGAGDWEQVRASALGE